MQKAKRIPFTAIPPCYPTPDNSDVLTGICALCGARMVTPRGAICNPTVCCECRGNARHSTIGGGIPGGPVEDSSPSQENAMRALEDCR